MEEIALKDKDYIRPIVLFQAENKNQEITVEVLEKYLVESEGIDRSQIAIATGEQRELDSINLFDPDCKIRYIITVQALKEGWDCSFAYVLCSVANTKSTTAVEQLLGRVLRMPYLDERRFEKDGNKIEYIRKVEAKPIGYFGETCIAAEKRICAKHNRSVGVIYQFRNDAIMQRRRIKECSNS